MPRRLDFWSQRLAAVSSLREKKGRSKLGRFAFEGPTLLREAIESGLVVEAIYATEAALPKVPAAAEREIPTFILDQRAMRRISDLHTPPGIVAVAPMRFERPDALLGEPGLVLALADLSDPGNLGTLLRCAEAAGASGVLCGDLGVEPYHPKVIRSAMGSLFRLRIAVANAREVGRAASGWEVTGLDAGGEPIDGLAWSQRTILVVGGERRGLGNWEDLCSRRAAIPMAGRTESLNAAVAGGIALYEASKRLAVRG